jgi:predicted nucleotidyltransferase
MDTLTNLDRDIPKLVSEHIDLFDSFENVYLFGSILKPEMVHNDVDILAIYLNYSNRINNDILMILDELEKASGLPVDLTVLSVEEEKDTTFLEKIKPYYLKIK